MRTRKTVRIILFDENNNVLLIKYRDKSVFSPSNPLQLDFWVTPGGKVNEEESDLDAMKREVWEETGILNITFGPLVWTRQHILKIDEKGVLFQEHYYIGRTTREKIVPKGLTKNERKIIKKYKWWTIEELEKSTEVFFPNEFIKQVIPLSKNQIPEEPIQLGDF